MELSKLKDKFADENVDWRIQACGKGNNGPWARITSYIDARTVMDRLDAVVGPANWCDHYEHINGGVKCTLEIKIDDDWVSKQDGSPETNTEAFKGGFSKAFVRAAVKWGVGRYLYDIPIEYAEIVSKGDSGANYHKDKKHNACCIWMLARGKYQPGPSGGGNGPSDTLNDI